MLLLLGAEAQSMDGALPALNLIANTGAVGLLAVIVVWLGPKLFKDWTTAHENVGKDLKSTIATLVDEQKRREDASRANIMAFISREKESFDRREDRMYQVLEKGMTATTQALNNMAEAERTQSTMLVGLQEAIKTLARTQDHPRGKQSPS